MAATTRFLDSWCQPFRLCHHPYHSWPACCQCSRRHSRRTSRSIGLRWPSEIDWLLADGARGVVMAMVSETLRLSTEERLAMADRVCRLVDGRGAVVISVGAESCHTAVVLARHAEQCGATALMAIPPISVGLPHRRE